MAQSVAREVNGGYRFYVAETYQEAQHAAKLDARRGKSRRQQWWPIPVLWVIAVATYVGGGGSGMAWAFFLAGSCYLVYNVYQMRKPAAPTAPIPGVRMQTFSDDTLYRLWEYTRRTSTQNSIFTETFLQDASSRRQQGYVDSLEGRARALKPRLDAIVHTTRLNEQMAAEYDAERDARGGSLEWD